MGDGAFEPSSTFVHLRDGGTAEPFAPTRAFWRDASSGGYDRILGAFDFASDRDLHADMQEVHPASDELIYLVTGAIDVLLADEAAEGGERRIALEAGQAAVVPRGVWHRLRVRAPGRLLFVNSRTGMETRRARGADGPGGGAR